MLHLRMRYGIFVLFCLLQVPSNHIEKETLDASEHEVQFSCEIQKADKYLSNQGVLEDTERRLPWHRPLQVSLWETSIKTPYLVWNRIQSSLSHCAHWIILTCSRLVQDQIMLCCMNPVPRGGCDLLGLFGCVESIFLIPTSLPIHFLSQEGNRAADGFCHWSMFLFATSQCKIAVISLEKG